jgi:CRP-like cAMP-binding protein
MKSYSPRNRLLLAVPARHLKVLMEDFEFIRCQRERILLDADSSLDHVFFPESGVVSVVAVYADGNIIEMATIGREGCTGVQAVFGSKASSARLLVQIPGGAAKMSRAAFDRAMKSMPAFRGLMFAYVQAFLEQVLVSVASNGRHSLKERLARWLLMMRDHLMQVLAFEARMAQLTNNFLFKDRCALPDQMSFVLTFPWRALVFAMRNRDRTNLDEISIFALSVTTKDFPHDMLL